MCACVCVGGCTGAKRIGVNPKVNNMVQGYEFARHDLILISDCGLRSKSVLTRLSIMCCFVPELQ